jgi:hypothetical protein
MAEINKHASLVNQKLDRALLIAINLDPEMIAQEVGYFSDSSIREFGEVFDRLMETIPNVSKRETCTVISQRRG